MLPVLLYPFSKTLWFAIHVAMEPLEPEEEAEAAATRFERGDVDNAAVIQRARGGPG